MAKRSQQWKALERQAAEALGGKRITRGDDFSRSDHDVEVEGFPEFKVDCKYRVRHAHHSLLEEVRQKYCSDGDIPILITKSHRQRGSCVTVDLAFFSELLDSHRAIRQYVQNHIENLANPVNDNPEASDEQGEE